LRYRGATPDPEKEKTGMVHFLWLLAGTIWLRPYLFIFLGANLLIAIYHLGAGRALAFLVLGYLISWAAEFASIHSGFPFANTSISPPRWTKKSGWPGCPSWIPCPRSFRPMPAIPWRCWR